MMLWENENCWCARHYGKMHHTSSEHSEAVDLQNARDRAEQESGR